MPFRFALPALRNARRACAAALAALICLAWPLRAAADPALWVIRDQDSTIYLMGTVHVLPAGTHWRHAKITKAIEDADELWLEIADVSSFAAQVLAAWSVFGQGVSLSRPLSKRLSPEDFAALERAAAQTGLDIAQIDHLRPWLAAMLIGAGASGSGGGRTVPGVDIQLQRAFSARNLPVHGFETIAGQVRAFSTLPEEDEIGFLLGVIRGADLGGEDLPSLVKTWLAGDVAGLSVAVNRPMRAASPTLYDALIVKRNAGFADGIERLLRGKGCAVVAIGAAHLAGPDNVQAFLATKGIHAVRQ